MEGIDRLLGAVQSERLLAELASFRAYGSAPGGGVERLALSPADVEARRALESAMGRAGLRVETDAVGNVWGRLGEGDGPAVVSGSHLDSVSRGGSLDGPLGVLAALEVARAMRDADLAPAVPFEVVCFTGEEGSRFGRGTLGSSVVSGALALEDALATTDAEGVTLAQAMSAGGYPDALPPPRPPEERFRAFVELHIEQGRVLESKGIPLGVVRAISGLTELEVDIRGAANHAGTTPMDLRVDALAAAAEMIVRIEQRARQANGSAVATVGRLHVSPNGSNVIPGEVRFGIDVRSADPAELEAMERDLRRVIAFVARVRGVSERARVSQHVVPCALDSSLAERLEAACKRIGEACHPMTSGAIHDALRIASVAPTAMLFVPSKGGRSHVPEEETSPEDVARGLQSLAAFVWDLCESPPGVS